MNALVATFSTGEAFEMMHAKKHKHKKHKKKKKGGVSQIKIDTSAYTVQLDETSRWFFSPGKGNVVFCSAKHKWAFTVDSVAAYYHKAKKMSRKVLAAKLWGNHYFYKNAIHKKPDKKGKHVLPMFVEFILLPIWSIYRHVYLEQFRRMPFSTHHQNIETSCCDTVVRRAWPNG